MEGIEDSMETSGNIRLNFLNVQIILWTIN